VRRSLARAIGAVLIAVIVAPCATVDARNSKAGGAELVDNLSDFANPPGVDKNSTGYVNPCLGREGFEEHISRATGLTKNDVEVVAFEYNDQTTTIQTSSTPGDVLGFSFVTNPTFEVEFVEWFTACGRDEESEGPLYQSGSQQRYWIRRPTPESIAPALVSRLIARLDPPETFWPNKDPDFGWLYVTVESDLRISPVQVETESATISNLVGSATVTLQATPTRIEFIPGEPGSSGVRCSYAAATAPFNIDFASSCYYRYSNSSSIGTEVPNAFVARTTLFWEIGVTGTGTLTYSDPESWREEPIQVAAVQAIEIANP